MREAAGSSPSSPPSYWRADDLAREVAAEFSSSLAAHDEGGARRAFFVIARYSRQTLGMIRSAAESGDDDVARAALGNLRVLHDAAAAMRREAPELVPDPMLLTHAAREHALDDLIVETLDAVAHPLSVHRLAERLAGGGRDVADMATALRPHVEALLRTGHVRIDREGRVARTGRGHRGLDRDRAVLTALAGPRLATALAAAGLHGVRDVAARPAVAARTAAAVCGWSADSANAFVSLAGGLAAEVRRAAPARPADLFHAPHVRAYQHEAHERLRDGGYRALVVDAPAGSGKTLMGLLCIADWLPGLAAGQTIVVVVPTLNVQQQWVRELCFSTIGLHLAPHLVRTGSAAVPRTRHPTGSPVLVVTYAALAAAGAGRGKGGFDRDAIEVFLQGHDVQYVILDEVHKVAEDESAVIAEVARLLVAWVEDGSLRGLVGLSATAAPHAAALARLGLSVAWELPELDLVAAGFVCPYAEASVGVWRSPRERDQQLTARAYRRELRRFLDVVGHDRLRGWYAAIPLDERRRAARRLLRMSGSGSDAQDRLDARLHTLERPGRLLAHELNLVWILQLARGWSDEDLLQRAAHAADADPAGDAVEAGRAPDAVKAAAALEAGEAADAALAGAVAVRGRAVLEELRRLRASFAASAGRADVRARLLRPGFGGAPAAADLAALADPRTSPSACFRIARDVLAGTAAGVAASLHDELRQIGEGRVAAVRSIVAAERRSRALSGVVVFERGGALRPLDGAAAPGWRGAAGTFAGLLEDATLTPMAVLPHELYLPVRAGRALPARIAAFIRERVLCRDLAVLVSEFATVGLELGLGRAELLGNLLSQRLRAHVEARRGPDAVRSDELDRAVLAPVRRWTRTAHLAGDAAIVRERLSRRHPHLRDWLRLFAAYAAVAAAFDQPARCAVHLANGHIEPVDVVRLPRGQRGSVAFDVVARVVDAGLSGTPFVDVVVVSSWARTGWNVLGPNVLIDATGTRDPIAWRQLRGRALRPWPSWDGSCQTQVGDLLAEGGAAGRRAAAALLLARNKVSHLFELLVGYGPRPQLRRDAARDWQRIGAAEDKHARESTVDLRSGDYGPGRDHVPLLVGDAPDAPPRGALDSQLDEILPDADTRIIAGWLSAAAPRIADQPGVPGPVSGRADGVPAPGAG